jgi:hypothetical protein
MKPTVGRIVHYFTESSRHGGIQTRPAIIVHVWPGNEDVVQLQVFTDGDNDGMKNVEWLTSVHHSENHEHRTWDWMDYQKGQAQKTEELEQRLAQASKPID